MTTDIAMPADASKILQDRIRATFLELLPKEKLDELIKKEWDRFFSDESRGSYSHHERIPAPFKVLVRKELNELFAEKLQKWIHEFQGSLWECTEDGARMAFGKARLDKNDFFAGVVKEVAPSVLDDLVATIVKSTVESMNARRNY